MQDALFIQLFCLVSAGLCVYLLRQYGRRLRFLAYIGLLLCLLAFLLPAFFL